MIINDPVFGFINVPEGLLVKLLNHPYVQRLSQIKQLGLACVVYPGAQHTRFQHSLGSFHLMSQAIVSLTEKGNILLPEEAEALQIAILLHDIGHGPYSHILEHALIEGVSHELITQKLMERINKELNGKLDTAIQLFKGTYPKKYLHQLICSQLDIDRLEYLCRDSFFTGVREGMIGADRIIRMLDVVDDRLVVASKGIYTIENYLMARRLMYWQVYLHKTAIAGEEALRATLRRAKELTLEGFEIEAPPALTYFLRNNVNAAFLETNPECLDYYTQLDDNDIWYAMKQWQHSRDKTLSLLSKNVVNRQLFKVEVLQAPATQEQINSWIQKIEKAYNLNRNEAAHFVSIRTVSQEMYSCTVEPVAFYFKDGTTKNIDDISEIISTDFAEKKSSRYYLFHQSLNRE
ncbi:MAG: HD domain-containing protein [Bacteroidaceae bacterium]